MIQNRKEDKPQKIKIQLQSTKKKEDKLVEHKKKSNPGSYFRKTTNCIVSLALDGVVRKLDVCWHTNRVLNAAERSTSAVEAVLTTVGHLIIASWRCQRARF